MVHRLSPAAAFESVMAGVPVTKLPACLQRRLRNCSWNGSTRAPPPEACSKRTSCNSLPSLSTCQRDDNKVRALLAKSRIELGQYERGLTDCGVASRLLDIEERLLGEREAEQVGGCGSAGETNV